MNMFKNIEASLLRFCSQFAGQEGISVLNMDAFTDEAQWPAEDFIGFGEFNLVVDEFYNGECAFMVSTINDTNLFRMRDRTGQLLELLLPNSAIEVVDADTGEFIGSLLVKNGVTVGAPVRTKTQPIRPIMLGFTSNIPGAKRAEPLHL